ncbi:hypothetical protein EBT25_01815 [bacterium]|jgi:Proliferating cell nuclear antigen, N-terminal domain|nr:hypothetical protein [bacterium]
MIRVRHTAKIFRAIFDVLKDLLCDVNIYFTKTGFYIQSIDPEKMSIITLQIAGSKLMEYEYDYEKDSMAFGIHAPLLYKLLRTASSTDVMQWLCNEQTMILSLQDTESWVNQTVTMVNILIPVDEYKVMGGQGVSFTINIKDFRKALKETTHLAQKIKFQIDKLGDVFLIADQEGIARSRYHLRWQAQDGIPENMTKEFYYRGIEKMLKLNIATAGTVTFSPGTDPFRVQLFFDCGHLEMFVAVIPTE